MSAVLLADRWLGAEGLLVAFSLCVVNVCSVVRKLVGGHTISTSSVRPMYLSLRHMLCYSRRRVSPKDSGSGVGLLEFMHGLHVQKPQVGLLSLTSLAVMSTCPQAAK
jgi:hypothetical protein